MLIFNIEKWNFKYKILLVFILNCSSILAQEKAENPIIWADVPDPSIIRKGDVYYMSSTTMHMNPGIPIMKSTDLVNWKIVNYAYQTLGNNEQLKLNDGKNAYGKGSWASSLRFYNDTYYVASFSSTTGKTYIFSTDDIEKGSWKEHSFEPSLHDNSLFFDDDGKIYMIYGAGEIHIVELKEDFSGLKSDTDKILIENASKPAGDKISLRAEGSQLFKIKGKYYLFNITWPTGGMRSVVVHRSDCINGRYQGKLVLQDKGVAQGGLVDTPDGRWFAYLFQDHGALGRIPYLVPVKWKDAWPVLGENNRVPKILHLPVNKSLMPVIVAADEFTRRKNARDLPLVWQWNHNPVDTLWSLSDREGYLRLTTGRTDSSVVQARNTLTQRTIGPVSQGIIKIDVSKMKNGDRTGLVALQEKYAWVGVLMEDNKKKIVKLATNLDTDSATIEESIPLKGEHIYLKIRCDFRNLKDQANFYYSYNGQSWKKIGDTLNMEYTLSHFMGYRYGLFNYATREPGGFVDFDYFHIENEL